MKKLILILAIFLSACGTISGPANFDNNEYALVNRIYTLADVYKLGCNDPEKTKRNFDKLAELSMELLNYSSDLPNNLDTVKLVNPLNKMISDADIKFNQEAHTVTYCKLKLDNINTSAGIVKEAIAKRRR